MFIQKEKQLVAERRCSRLPNYVAWRVHNLALLCEHERRGDFYLQLVDTVSHFSIYLTGLEK